MTKIIETGYTEPCECGGVLKAKAEISELCYPIDFMECDDCGKCYRVGGGYLD